MIAESLIAGDYPEAVDGVAVAENNGLTRVAVTFQGCSPLLVNAMSTEVLLTIGAGSGSGRKAPKTRARPQPRDEAKSKLHLLPDGRPCLPPRALYACFINAGQFVRLDGKRQVSTEKKTTLPGMMLLEDVTIPLLNSAGEPATWEVDIQKGTNPNGGEAVCIIRPRFDDWQFKVTLSIDQNYMPLSLARQLIDIAGSRIGLLEFRPQRKGMFGRFNVKRWEEFKS